MRGDVGLRFLMAIGVAASGCYDVPKPQCGFRCGAAGCPEGYTCGPDNFCRLPSAPPDLVCATPDAGPPADAYSPNVILLSSTTPDPAEPILVLFDVEVTDVSETTFTVTNTATQAALTGTVVYQAGLRRATFEPDPHFPESTALQVRLDDTITAISSGRPLLPTTFDITTGEDTLPPQVIQLTPANGATGVDVGLTASVRFSEPVMGVDDVSMTLADAAMTAVAGVVVYDAGTRTATFDPDAPLAPNTSYTLTLTSAIADTAGNALAGAPVTSTFTTAP